jgi:hypothetical protein
MINMRFPIGFGGIVALPPGVEGGPLLYDLRSSLGRAAADVISHEDGTLRFEVRLHNDTWFPTPIRLLDSGYVAVIAIGNRAGFRYEVQSIGRSSLIAVSGLILGEMLAGDWLVGAALALAFASGSFWVGQAYFIAALNRAIRGKKVR